MSCVDLGTTDLLHFFGNAASVSSYMSSLIQTDLPSWKPN